LLKKNFPRFIEAFLPYFALFLVVENQKIFEANKKNRFSTGETF
jgi:hypothetical protein